MNSYELSRAFFDYCFCNPEKIKPTHIALYFFAIEHCNRLGWKKKFGFPSTMAMEALGIKSYNTYSKTLQDLVEFGFINMVEKSKNQYSANIIALSKFDNAPYKALDKALMKHSTKQSESTIQSIDSIDKQYNNITKNKEQIQPTAFSMFNSLKKLGAEKDLINDWLKVRKTKKATNTQVALNGFLSEVEKSKKPLNYILKTCVENSWSGFKVGWLNTLTDNNSRLAESSINTKIKEL